MMKVISILGFDLSYESVAVIVRSLLDDDNISVVNSLNQHSYIEAKKDKIFHDALQDSDILIPDGSGIVLAAKIINKVSISKISGYDLFYESMMQLNCQNGRVFFLGSSQRVLDIISEKGAQEFPNLKIKTLSPPFKEKFDNCDIDFFVKSINSFNPDVLFVGLTAPKQEKLIHQIKSQVRVKMVSGIGAVFDFYAGTIVRPNSIWIKLHLEWLIRFIREPKRLWRRTFVSAPLFIFEILLWKLRIKKSK